MTAAALPPRVQARSRDRAGERAGSGWRLSRRARKVALIAHVLASVGWFGIAAMVAFCGIGALSSSDPVLVRSLVRTLEVAPWLSIPTGFAAAATGALLSVGTRYGLVRYWWVVMKILIAVAVVVTDAVIIARAAHDAVATGSVPGPLRDGAIAHVVVLALATVLSVVKPFGRTPRGRRLLAEQAVVAY